MNRFLTAIYMQFNDRMGRISRKLWRNSLERRYLKNRDITIFSQNCIGGIMYHDLGLQFQSPTVNLLFEPKEFVRFMKDIEWYLNQKIEFIKSDELYPIGKIGGDVTIKFLHYHSSREAEKSWNRRTKRINWNNIFVICCDEGLSYEDMIEFDNLPYKNKILFLHENRQEINCGIFTQCFHDKTDARLLNFSNPLGKRYYQKYIDYVSWLNGNKNFVYRIKDKI